MDEYSLKYLHDVLNACEEVELFFEGEKVFAEFQNDIPPSACCGTQCGDYGRGYQSVDETRPIDCSPQCQRQLSALEIELFMPTIM